jgi:hypothetical protein
LRRACARPKIPTWSRSNRERFRFGESFRSTPKTRSSADRNCPFLYAFVEHGRTYVGCMQKVYDVEIDLELLREAEGRRSGFGAVRASRRPLPMCEVEVASCYESKGDELGCVNPEFFELPDGKPSFRIFASVPSDR